MGSDRTEPLTETLGRRVRAGAERRVGIDARALAAFRIGIAAVVVLDLVLRAGEVVAFYTDAGVLSRRAVREQARLAWLVSLNTLSGTAEAQLALVAAGILAATAMLVGFRTRLATAATALVVISFQYRNLAVLNGGDVLFRYLLIWSVLLPLGARWSLDARRRARRPPGRVASLASLLLLLQVVAVYAVNAAEKLRGDAWLAGDAVATVFGLHQFVVGLGPLIADVPSLHRWVTWLWLGLVVASPLLLLATGRIRTLLVVGFVGAHLGMVATLRIGVFPLVTIVALVPFLPTGVWDGVERRLPDRGIADDGSGMRPTVSWPAYVDRGRRPWMPAVLAVLAALGLVLLVTWNGAALGYLDTPETGHEGADVVLDGPTWSMFAPEPLSTSVWNVAPAHLENGSRVDALRGSSVDWRPPPPPDAAPPARWRKYLANVRRDADADRRRLSQYLCRRWNGTHDVGMVNVTIAALEWPADADPDVGSKERYGTRECAGGAVAAPPPLG